MTRLLGIEVKPLTIAAAAAVVIVLLGCLWVLWARARRRRRRRRLVLQDSSGSRGRLLVQTVPGEDDILIRKSELRIGRELGRGSMGVVHAGLYHDTEVAIKVLHGGVAQSVQTFLEEVRVNRRLRHPNIVLYMGVCTEPPTPCFVTEYMGNGSLWDVLHDPRIGNDTLTWKRRLKFAMDAAQGMTHLHSLRPPIIHRDLKTANLLVTTDWVVKVADFGLSKPSSAIVSQRDRTGFTGSPAYTAPEVLNGGRHTERSDVYSFGIILWEMAMRERPYVREVFPVITLLAKISEGYRPPPIPQQHCPRGYNEMVYQCWDANPAARPEFRDISQKLKDMAGLPKRYSTRPMA